MTLLIVNADDFGLTEGVSRAILDAHRDGVVTSTSVLTLAPGFERTARLLLDAPTLGTGAHLAAVGEDPPLLGASEIPSLVDRRGRLHLSWRSFLPACAAGRIDPDDLRREFDAQLRRVRDVGVTVDHLDTHQNVHLWPMVREVVLDVGARADVRVIRVTRSGARGVVGTTVRRLAARLEARLDVAGWRYAAASTGLDEAGGLDEPGMLAALTRLAGAETAELATHPGPADDPARDRYRWGYRWGEELAALRSPAVRAAVARGGFTLGTFADLRHRPHRGRAHPEPPRSGPPRPGPSSPSSGGR